MLTQLPCHAPRRLKLKRTPRRRQRCKVYCCLIQRKANSLRREEHAKMKYKFGSIAAILGVWLLWLCLSGTAGTDGYVMIGHSDHQILGLQVSSRAPRRWLIMDPEELFGTNHKAMAFVMNCYKQADLFMHDFGGRAI